MDLESDEKVHLLTWDVFCSKYPFKNSNNLLLEQLFVRNQSYFVFVWILILFYHHYCLTNCLKVCKRANGNLLTADGAIVMGIVSGCCCGCDVVNRLLLLNRLPPENDRTFAAGRDVMPTGWGTYPGSSCGGRAMSRWSARLRSKTTEWE